MFMSFLHLFANQIENQLSIPDRLMKQSNPFLFPPTGSLLALSHFALFFILEVSYLSGFFFLLEDIPLRVGDSIFGTFATFSANDQ